MNALESEVADNDSLMSNKLKKDLRKTQQNMSQIIEDYEVSGEGYTVLCIIHYVNYFQCMWFVCVCAHLICCHISDIEQGTKNPLDLATIQKCAHINVIFIVHVRM